MKKVLLLFVALFMATVANAQFDICVGPKVGYQTTKLSLDKNDIKSDFKGNMTFGLFGRVTIKKIIIQPELMYFKSGKVFDLSTLGNDWGQGGLESYIPNPTLSINQANLALPIFLGYQFVDVPFFKMRANVGPVFYFALGKGEYKMEGYDKPIEVETEDMTMGAALNLGVDVWRFTLDVNYSFGLTKAIDDDFKLDIPEIEDKNIELDSKQNIFTVTVGFKLL